jgi:hypothetical protein
VSSERQPLLVQIHIPKTGGAALRGIISSELGGRFKQKLNTITHPEKAEARIRAIGAGEGVRPPALCGHIVFGLRDLLPPDTRYVTVLREPVERTLSHYGYLVAPRDPALHPHGLLSRDSPYRPEMSLEECLSDPDYLLDNLQTRMIVCRRSPFEELPVDALEQAKKHLQERFAFVGVTERLDELIVLLTTAYGWRLRIPGRRHVSGARLQRADLSPATLRAVEAQNALDLDLHVFARGLMDRAVEAVAPDVGLGLDSLDRARELQGGAAPSASPPTDLRSRLVEAQAELLVQEAQVARLRSKLARRQQQTSGRPAS